MEDLCESSCEGWMVASHQLHEWCTHLVNSVSDVLDALQRDRGLARPHVKADLQRQSLLRLTPFESVMPSSHLILCRPLLPHLQTQHQGLFQ